MTDRERRPEPGIGRAVRPERPWVRPAGAVLGSAAVLLSLVAEAGSGVDLRVGALGIAVIVAASSLPVLRLWWPDPIAVVSAVAGAALLAVDAPVAAPSLLLAIALYTIASRRPMRVLWIGTAAAAGLVVALVGGLHGQWALTLPALLIIVIGAAAADGSRVRSAYDAAIDAQLARMAAEREAQARRRVVEERLRIARELHDALAHQVAVINLHSGAASRALRERPDDAEQSLATIRSAARTVLEEMSDILSILRGPESEDPDRAARRPVGTLLDVDRLIAEFDASGLTVRAEVIGDPDPDGLADAASIVAYRVIQEGLANALKHGRGREVSLWLSHGPDAVRVELRNPVRADRADRAAPGADDPARLGSGHGLVGLRERVEASGGTVLAGRDGDDYRLAVELPLRRVRA